MLKRLAVLGHPVGHSRSPAMQNAALAELGLSTDWTYEAIDVEADAFEGLVREMPAGGFAGVNVTVPHKRAALEVADEASDVAREIGAANTLTFTDAGIRADNTDAEGLLAALEERPSGRALVLGAGGAARAVVWALAGAGCQVEIWNRTAERAEELATELGGSAIAAPGGGSYELIVNSTSLGLDGRDQFPDLPIEAGDIREGQTVVDLVYGESPTSLLTAAEAAGARKVDGLEILVRQGAASLRIWTGRDASLDVLRAAARGAS